MFMDAKTRNILKHVDHTLLDPKATRKEVLTLCREAAVMNAASVCIPPCYVELASSYLHDIKSSNPIAIKFGCVHHHVKVCTVIGFPNGNTSTRAKIDEAVQAIRDGAEEIDMVANIGMITDGEFVYVSKEINRVREAIDLEYRKMYEDTRMNPTLKVIVESGTIKKSDIVTMCNICALAGVDYIKTSTGFNGYGGATLGDVQLMSSQASVLNKKYKSKMKVKASGGIKTVKDAEDYLESGADRLGTSSLIGKFIQEEYDKKNKEKIAPSLYYENDTPYSICIEESYDELKKFNILDGLQECVLHEANYILSVKKAGETIALLALQFGDTCYINRLWKVNTDENARDVVGFIKAWTNNNKISLTQSARDNLDLLIEQ